MTKEELFLKIKARESFLCVGLDTDLSKIPPHLLSEKDPIFEFNRQIIDATVDYCVSYKPNTAFYEAEGIKGWESLQKTIEYIPKSHFTIADAKRGDIGNTSSMYAKAFFQNLSFDAVTVAPYMGEDSVKPFIDFKDKWAIILALTSNDGSKDFQTIKAHDSLYFFEKVLTTAKTWGTVDQLMFVVGATKAEELKHIRNIIPDHFLLVPGVGAQGGSLEDVCRFGMNNKCGLLVNSSRNIIYASNGKDFGIKAGEEAKKIKVQMTEYLNRYI